MMQQKQYKTIRAKSVKMWGWLLIAAIGVYVLAALLTQLSFG